MAGVNTSIQGATTSARGEVKLAGNTNAIAGTDTSLAMTPDDVRYVLDHRIGPIIAGADAKNTPHDNDVLGLADSEASNIIKKLSWSYVKSTLKTYIDAMTSTFTNKRISKRVTTITSSATPTINTDNCDYVEITELAENITNMSTNLSGTPTKGQTLWVNIACVGSSPSEDYDIEWGTSFEGSLLPVTINDTERMDVGFIWNNITSKWRCVAVNVEV